MRVEHKKQRLGRCREEETERKRAILIPCLTIAATWRAASLSGWWFEQQSWYSLILCRFTFLTLKWLIEPQWIFKKNRKNSFRPVGGGWCCRPLTDNNDIRIQGNLHYKYLCSRDHHQYLCNCGSLSRKCTQRSAKQTSFIATCSLFQQRKFRREGRSVSQKRKDTAREIMVNDYHLPHRQQQDDITCLFHLKYSNTWAQIQATTT